MKTEIESGIAVKWDSTKTKLNAMFDELYSSIESKIKYFRIVETFDADSSKTIVVSGAVIRQEYKIFENGIRATINYSGSGTEDAYAEVEKTRIFDGSIPFVLPIYVHASNANSIIGLYLSNTSFSSGPNIWLSIGELTPGYYFLVFPSKDWVHPASSDHLSGPYKKLRIYIRQSGGDVSSQTDITFLGLFQGLHKPQICIQFDDGLESVITNGYPILQAVGLVGSVPAMGTELGGTYGGYDLMSAEQLTTLRNAGWEICVHGTTRHADLGTEASILSNINASKNALAGVGLTGALDLYVYPGGSILETADASFNALASAGMTYARTTGGALGGMLGTFAGYGLSDIVKPNPYRFQSYSLGQTRFTPSATIYNQLSASIDNGTSIIFYTHGVIDAETVDAGREDNDITVAQLTEFTSRLAQYQRAGMCDVVTWRQMLDTIPIAY